MIFNRFEYQVHYVTDFEQEFEFLQKICNAVPVYVEPGNFALVACGDTRIAIEVNPDRKGEIALVKVTDEFDREYEVAKTLEGFSFVQDFPGRHRGGRYATFETPSGHRMLLSDSWPIPLEYSKWMATLAG